MTSYFVIMNMSTNSILAISLIAVLLIGVVSFDDAFADHKPSHQSNAGGVSNLQTQVDENTASVDSFFDVFTELQTDVDTIYGHVTVLKGQSDPFFDVFYETFSVDSFFDVFTELQTDVDAIDIELIQLSLRADETDVHVTVLKSQSEEGDADLQRQIDHNEVGILKGNERSLDADNQHDEDIARIDTEILSMDLRGQSCGVGDVVTGVDANGELLCATGSGDTSALQEQIDELDV